MYVCYLCTFTTDEIPDDAIQIGKLYRFSDGTFHWLRKKYAARTKPRPPGRRINPDHEALSATAAQENQ
jgi:hypothetical protein